MGFLNRFLDIYRKSLCLILPHDYRQISSETTEPDGVIKVTDECCRCGEVREFYYLSLPLPPRRVVLGVDPANEDGDYMARVYGYIEGGTMYITKIEQGKE